MKRLCFFISSLIFFLGCFVFNGLDSFALSTVEPLTEGFHNGVLKYDTYGGGNTYLVQYDIIENSSYDRSGLVCYYDRNFSQIYEQWIIISVKDLLNGTYDSNIYFATAQKTTTNLSGGGDPTVSNETWVNTGNGHAVAVYFDVPLVTTDFPVFSSASKAIDFYRYGLLDDDSIRYGEEYLNQSIYTEQVYDPQQIPAPTVEWVTDQYGNFTHKLHFLNNGYFGEHNTQLNYGLLLEMHWLSVNAGELSLVSNTSNLNTKYKFTASSFCQSDQISIYSRPTLGEYFDFTQYECPPYLDLDQNGLAINGFNAMLTSFPVSGRNLTAQGGFNNSSSILNNVIKTGLGQISYRMNCPSVSCQYFVIGEDNKLYKGPITQIHIGFPNPSYFSDTGTITSYEPSTSQDFNPESGEPITPPTTTNPPSAPNPGVQDPYQVPDYTDVNAAELVSNMTSLFSFVRQMPDFMRMLFSFLPEWILVFIAVSIGIVIAIGVVKLFVG